MFLDERQRLAQFSPLPPSIMSSQGLSFLPTMSHSTPVNILQRPQAMLPGHLSPLNYSKLSPVGTSSGQSDRPYQPLSLSTTSPDSAFSPVNRSRDSSMNLSPLSHSYSPLNQSAVTPPTGYLGRLRSHPMFQDLQRFLAQECNHLQVPASLITSNWNLDHLQSATSPSSVETSRDHATSSSQQVYALHMQLQDRFLRLHGDNDLHETSRKMESLYCSEVGRIEMQRYQSLCTSYTESSKYAVNIHYNKERIALVEKLQKEVDIITKLPPTTSTPITSLRQSGFASRDASSSTNSTFNEINSAPRPADAQSHSSSASLSEGFPSTSTSSMSISSSSSASSNSSINSATSSISSLNSASASIITSPETNSSKESIEETPVTRSRTGRLLSPETIRMLSNWYDAHMTYPYPNDEDVEELATRGGITHGQVRKWLANKRVRSFNTLSITGNDHPIKYKYRGKKGADTSTETHASRRPQYKLLSSAAKNILNDWYECHSEHPYPTDEEKEDLAEKAGVSPAQVKSWFANKRSRTNNTKRQVPNYFIKKFPGYTPIVEMVSEQRAARKTTGKTIERVRMDLYQPCNMA
ncbi:uncharacterized protein LOC126809721 [Patella vulgata]|uniref:uncharacterized protein LOC126809721 n=1 Tax=Patella vulgata TaxID=6465 RepID=UPI0024A974FB|nr:uncharacterized protein LOC126809721 [Patella vulgata]